MANPRISVLLPVHNGGRFIDAAVESVLRQSFTDFELVVVNDNSTDATEERVRAFSDRRIIVVSNSQNLGLQKSLNVGLQRARGGYVARIDDDDVWLDPNKLAKQFDFLERNPEYALIGTGAVITDETGRELFRFLNPASDREIRSALLARNCFVHSSVLFLKSEALRHGGYSEHADRRYVEDYDLWLAIGRRRKLANVPEYCVRYTQRSSSISGKHRIAQYTNNLRLVRECGAGFPNRRVALARSALRLLVYGYLNLGGLRGLSARFK